ncbi:glycosyltransferase family 4 protein [Candidatus Pelagibacter sp.]|uniref:glycosyltransferase family 4 protein n=1 Tax=Candidatus Pelagibacter sp. TaxID=2024849 RepID=UPI003F878676
MKIAFVSGVFFPQPGGAQVQFHNFANKLVEKNYNIDFYIFRNTNIKNNKYKIIKINYFLLSVVYFCLYYLNFDVSFLLNFWIKKVIKKNYNLWHFNFINFKSLILINCLKKFNQKIIVTFQGVDIQIHPEIKYGYRLNKKYDIYLKKTLTNIDKFISISQNIENDLIKLNVKKSKIKNIPNTVHIEKFEKINIKKNKQEILNMITVGRFAEQKKGFDLIGDFCHLLRKKKINFKWKIIGKNTSKILEQNIKNKNVNGIEVIENIENIEEDYFPSSSLIKHYKNSNLYINLSRVESFGITFVESLASGVPIISFDTKGVNELIKNGINGFLIKKFELENFINKIEEIYKNKKLLNSLAYEAKRSVKNFDLNKNTKHLINLYNSI